MSEGDGLAGLKHGIAVPNFHSDPNDLIELGVATEEAGFDGYFLWDHIVFSNRGDGPPVQDPWAVLSVVAARTSRITIGTVVTPVPRRRPWQLARQTTTLDLLSDGRVVLGVGIGSPAYGDFGIFGEPSGDRERGELLDEGLDVLAGLWSGERFSYAGRHLNVDSVRFRPTPVQRPRIPVWVAGVLPAPRPIARAARWDGFVPIRWSEADGLIRPSASDIADVTGQIAARRAAQDTSTSTGYDMVVWAEVAAEPAALPGLAGPYADAGATWWIETARPEPDWWEGVQARVKAGPLGGA
ncbi:MAG TPA: LLM class flavin-dependent oxidoreductase [Streptosporangiaceae bacterium]|nr:LLM class flavin-dependent oxidoreductase [Streptosporangiaceae bacterium]